jgi:hypothetical protein
MKASKGQNVVDLAATKIQSLVHQDIARTAVRQELQAAGQLLAMAGTVQSQSGWYEILQGRRDWFGTHQADPTRSWAEANCEI